MSVRRMAERKFSSRYETGPVMLTPKAHYCHRKCSRPFLRGWEGSRIRLYVVIKQFHCRTGQALRVSGCWGSQISRQSAHEGGKVVSPTHRPPLPPRKYSWYSFLLEGPEGLCQWKIPMTPSGIEPAAFRLVAQCNQLRHRVPPVCRGEGKICDAILESNPYPPEIECVGVFMETA